MKKSLLLLILSINFTFAYAQLQNNYGYSIGLKAFNMVQMPKILNQINAQDYTYTTANGIFVKFIDNQISYRIIGSYYKKDILFFNQCNTCQEGSGKRTDYYIKAGFEKSFNYAIVQPYFGFDLGYRADNFDGVVQSIQTGSTTLPYNVESTKTGVILSPLLGLKINILPQLSFFAEGSLDFYYAYERRETVDQVVGSPTSLNRFTRMEYLLNPFSVGVQIQLGTKR